MIDTAEARRAEDYARATAGVLGQTALLYSDLIGDMVRASKNDDPEISKIWQDIEALIDIPSFVRYGAFREVGGWAEYRALLESWAGTTDFWYNFRRFSEAGDRVFWEIEEHNTPVGGVETVANSMTAFQFNAGGKIVRLDVYLQAEIMLSAHENWG